MGGGNFNQRSFEGNSSESSRGLNNKLSKRILSLTVSIILTISIIILVKSYYVNHPEKVEEMVNGPLKGIVDLGKEIISPKGKIDIIDLELEIHNLVNVERSKNGLNTLLWDSKLGQIARTHSRDMVKRDFFSHENPDGESPTERGLAAGYECVKEYNSYYKKGLGENLAEISVHYNVEGCGKTNTVETLANCIVQGWMNSTGHRENILNQEYTLSGVGVAYDEGINSYTTQVFC
jgi:uncharacterized protein YkwD